MMLPEYEIYAIKYGERIGTRGQTFAGGDPHDAPLPMDYFVWVLRAGVRTIRVTAATNARESRRR